MAEALAHSNEFVDGQLLLSLHTTRPFNHGVTVSAERRTRLDKFVGHVLSLARRSLILLPAPPLAAVCRDNRLANWVHGSESWTPEKAIPGRLKRAADAYGLRLHLTRRLHGLAADGCQYEVWEATLLHMDRLNRHHYCLGGCKTHTRRTYRMIYDAAGPAAFASDPQATPKGRMNMTNTQTGRRIPFETGSINMHSLLSLQGEAVGSAVPAARAARQSLILMFLSLPVFQDPAPWNVVWRHGELFTIDVGDGLTMEQRPVHEGKTAWDVFAQKYIGSVNECYRMSLKTLCGLAAGEAHGEDRYSACMSSHFAGICPSHAPYPCLNGCNTSYQRCRHLPPDAVVPGWFASTSPHANGHRKRFAQFMPAASVSIGGREVGEGNRTGHTTAGDATADEPNAFGSPDLLRAQLASAARRVHPHNRLAAVDNGSHATASGRRAHKEHRRSKKHNSSIQAESLRQAAASEPARNTADTAPREARAPAASETQSRSKGHAAAADSAAAEGNLAVGLAQILRLRGMASASHGSTPDVPAVETLDTNRVGELRSGGSIPPSFAAAGGAESIAAVHGSHTFSTLSLVQLAIIMLLIAQYYCGNAHGRRLLYSAGSDLRRRIRGGQPMSHGAGRGEQQPHPHIASGQESGPESGSRRRVAGRTDSRLLGEL